MKLFGRELKLFNYSLDGKGVKKEPEGPKNLKNFFISYWRKFGQLVTVNIYYVFGNFPVLFAMLAISGNLNVKLSAPTSSLYSALYGLMENGANTPLLATLNGIHGVSGELSIPTTATNVFWWLSLLVLVTFGLVNVGCTYILRNMVKGEPIFMWTDFWYAIKRNWRQGIILGVLDLVFMGVIAYDIVFFNLNTSNFMLGVFFWFSIALSVIYLFMRFYMYIVMVTFDLSIFKILKNALIFSLLGIKRNVMALLGIALSLFITWYTLNLFVPLGIIIPFVALFGTCSFMGAYAAFPKIKQYMIDPYYVEEEDEGDFEEPIFKDRG